MATLTVGAGQQFSTLSAAVAASQNGDVIQVQAGTYTNDFPAMITDNITVEGVGGMANFVATASPPNGKAILDTAANVTIDHLSFSGVTVPDGNGAGIRYESGNLVLTNDSFSNNQDGVLAAADPSGSIAISNSVFDANGSGTGYTHNIYIGDVGSLTVTNSLFEDVSAGHELKSRAESNTITGNVIANGPNGTGSYDIDFPDGGNNTVTNNTIEKGPNSQNPIMISAGEEGGIYANSSLTVSGNTLIDDDQRASSLGVANDTGGPASVTGNLVYGLNGGNVLGGGGTAANNTFLTTEPGYSTASPIGGSTATGGGTSAGGSSAGGSPAGGSSAGGGTGGSSTGTGDSGLVLDVSEDAWQGDAQFVVSVDGQQIGGTNTATALHGAGQTEAFPIGVTLAAGWHDIDVSFLNDAWGGSASTDRNLYVDSIALNGQTIAGATTTMLYSGTASFGFTAPSAVTSPAPDPTPTPTPAPPAPTPDPSPAPSGSGLVLYISEDAWQGDAQFVVSIDGQQVGDTYTATALHGAGQTEAFAIPATLAPGSHDLGVTFLNDAWGGSSSADRNLYVDSVALNGQVVPGASTTMLYSGTADFTVTGSGTATNPAPTPAPVPDPAPTPSPAPAPTGSSLVLDLSEDAWQGDAQFVVTVDGQQVGGTETASASHAAGQTSVYAVPVTLGAGTHDVAVSFLNDAWGGSASADRNLYLDGATLNGQAVAGASTTFLYSGTWDFSVVVPAHS